MWYNDRQNRTARPNTCDTAVHRNEGVRFTEDKWHPGSTMRFSTRFIRSRSTIRTVTASAISKASSTNSTTSATSAATQSGSTPVSTHRSTMPATTYATTTPPPNATAPTKTCTDCSTAHMNSTCTYCSTWCQGTPQSTIHGSWNPAKARATHGPTAISGVR